MVILSFFLVRTQSYINPFAKITYLDVGQGDCTLIQLPFHTGNILIDTGGMLKEDLAKTVLVPYLNGKGISELDMVVITHDDFDHNGALESLKEVMPIDCIVTERQNNYTVGNFRMLEVSEDQTGDTDNDTSLTCWYQINNLTFLQCGDLGKQKEDDIIKQYNITCDVLKLSHHGSDSSSSSYYLSHLHPQIAIVSSGYQNTYHHPSTSVTDNLRRLGIPYLNTAEEGAIHIIVGRWIRFFYTERGMFGIIKPGDKR
ncbi:MAG: MBL fold metallo-hydrolase [Erysipelotrichaceae bacterium]|nr:MBL fold metallo-hydrolase [Erysipelotrichaceae bacterium]